MKTIIKKRFDIQIVSANTTVADTFELDKTIVRVNGVLVTSDKDDVLYYRGSQKIEINKQEYFPDGYESKLLMSGLNVPLNQRYYNLGGVAPGNGRITLTYKDSDDGRSEFIPYRVSLYLDCETEDVL
jgi:hypothetical protein